MPKSEKQKFRDRLVTILKRHNLAVERTTISRRLGIVWILFEWNCDDDLKRLYHTLVSHAYKNFRLTARWDDPAMAATVGEHGDFRYIFLIFYPNDEGEFIISDYQDSSDPK